MNDIHHLRAFLRQHVVAQLQKPNSLVNLPLHVYPKPWILIQTVDPSRFSILFHFLTSQKKLFCYPNQCNSDYQKVQRTANSMNLVDFSLCSILTTKLPIVSFKLIIYKCKRKSKEDVLAENLQRCLSIV